MPTVLQANELQRSFPRGAEAPIPVLRDVTLAVDEREFVTVMGPSGSGKTTLLHCLAGLDRPTAGTVVLGDVDLGSVSERERTLVRRRTIGFVFQFFNLMPDLTVRENVELPILIAGDAPRHHRGRVDELLDALGIAELHDRLPHALSGGEMQRVSIARALASRPPLILADEPTGNLATKAGEETMDLFRDVRERYGTAILLVTHNPRDAAYGDRVLFLLDGVLDPANTMTGPDLDATAVFSRLEALGI